MAQAGDVPNLLCAQMTGATVKPSTNQSLIIRARLLVRPARPALRIDVLVCRETVRSLDAFAGIARSTS
jgi:hypothetical protein